MKLILSVLFCVVNGSWHGPSGPTGLTKLHNFLSHLKKEYQAPLLVEEKSDRQKEIDSYIIQ